MVNILSEKDYQHFIMDQLKQNNGYIVRNADKYDRNFAIDRELLFKFLDDTQPKTMEQLRKIYKDQTEETIINHLNTEAIKSGGSLIELLKHGTELANYQLDLMYSKPAANINKDLVKKYNQNIFSVMEEVWISDKERVDLVIFLNGLAIMSFELKCNTAGQSYQDAIFQYRTERNPHNRLFLFKAGCLVNFAMDLNEVYMCTHLNGQSSVFFPFNMGNGNGVDAGAGNPACKDKFSVHYMWDDILQKDTILDLITKFILLEVSEKKDNITEKVKKSETLIFPRYHQLDVIRKLLADVQEHETSQNYLIQHSAGSGKTNSIAWLAHRLISLHNKEDRVIFDNIVIVTDRIVVDRQLQAAILGIEHKGGVIRVMDEKCNSTDLANALKGNTKIIATTIQKFPYIIDTVKNLNKKKFAVIIDEAHSSTAGKDMAAVTKALGAGDEEPVDDIETTILREIGGNGKQKNVSMFAFTATPKATTLQMFGRTNTKGQKEAFHIYSMKQAIQEGFILDVLQNYITYDTYFKINKEIEDDPKYKTGAAKRKIARFVRLHETNIAQKIEIIIEHFRKCVQKELGGTAKAMVVTGSRAEAVKYRKAFDDYIEKNGYTDVHALVAFSGKVKLRGDSKEYSEAEMNGFSEDKLTKEFDKNDYQILLVANKYQTGFDQPKLCAMYILKKLNGVAAVQTLSRLNRICPPYDKKTIILDFVNTYEDIKKSFAPYYTTTLLAGSVSQKAIYDLEVKVDSFCVIDPDDVERLNEIVFGKEITSKEKEKIAFMLNKCKKTIDEWEYKKQKEFVATLRGFVRYYQFLIQVSNFTDTQIHRKYNFISYLLAYINIKHPGSGFDLDGKIKATNFIQKKTGEHKKPDQKSEPIIKLPVADPIVLSEDREKKLSEIIKEINSKTGKNYDNDVAVKAALQIRDIMLKSETLKACAKSNPLKDFKFPYNDAIDDALVEGLSQNRDFFTLLLKNKDIKEEVLGIFVNEIYKSLKKS